MSPLKAISAFNEIWSFWPNQDDMGGSLTGFKFVATSENLNPEKVIECARIHVNEVDAEYCHRLGNWMRDSHYLGYYDLPDSKLAEISAELTNKSEAASNLISSWNKCADVNSKFYKVLAVDDRMKICMKSMRNKFFAANHLDALKHLYLILSDDYPHDDPRSFIKPTMQWFCDVRYDKFIVAKILEGEYGKPKEKPKRIQREATQIKSEFTNSQEALQYFENL